MSQDPKPVDLSNVSIDDLVMEIQRRYKASVIVYCTDLKKGEATTHLDGKRNVLTAMLLPVLRKASGTTSN